MDGRIGSALACAAIGVGLAATAARGQQVIERDTKVTGPRGRTIERDIRVERGPGYIDRRVEIKRPGESLIRDTRVAAPGGRPHGGHGPGYGPGPRFYGGGGPVIEEIIVAPPPPPPPIFSTFLGLPGFSLFLGGPPAIPPPVVIYPEPAYAYPPPPMVVAPPPPATAPSPPPQIVVDPLTEPLSRLKSLHSNSRRDGCLAIGSLRDPRAVPSLAERLEHDFEKEVRVAAAWALGEIGDPRAAVPLERAALYDKRNDVRQAAKAAFARLPRPGQAPTEPTTSGPTEYQPRPAPSAGRPEVYDQGPTTRPVPDDFPPPPPIPATGPTLEPPRGAF